VISHHYTSAAVLAKFEHFSCRLPPQQKEPPLRENYYPRDCADDIFLARLLLMPGHILVPDKGFMSPASLSWQGRTGNKSCN